jgi:DNA polymerase III delta prime subunit
MNDNNEIVNFIWAEKYRPNKIMDCVLPKETRSIVSDLVSKGEIPHFLFVGGPGCGKTTLAKALADEIGSDFLFINASMDNSIDVLRTKIQAFASTISLSDSGPKIICLDEADGLSGAFQGALKGFLEAFSANCRFIFTANVRSKIIEPIQSRCTVIDFRFKANEKLFLAKEMMKRVIHILKTENVEYDEKVLAQLVFTNFPDFRKTLNECQRNSANGLTDISILDNNSDFKELFELIKAKKFTETRKWLAKNPDIDSNVLFRTFYDESINYISPKSIPQLILLIAEYQYKSSFVADQEINIMAFLTESMGSLEFL